MRTTIVVAALALGMTGAAAASPAVAAVPTATIEASAATLSVTGYGEISRAPDLATVAVAIVTGDDNGARSLSENNRRFAGLMTKLNALGIVGADVQSASISSYFNARPAAAAADAKNQFGFIVTRNVQINVHDLNITGSVIDAATASGATQINGVSYGFRDRPALERAALTAAVNDAYAQAQTIAGAAHLRIVRVLSIGNDNGPPIRLRAQSAVMSRMAAAPVPTTVEPTAEDITRTIAVTYIVR